MMGRINQRKFMDALRKETQRRENITEDNRETCRKPSGLHVVVSASNTPAYFHLSSSNISRNCPTVDAYVREGKN